MTTLSLPHETGAAHLPPRAAAAAATMSVASALRRRRGTPAFRPDPIRLEDVSRLLRGAFDVDRPGSWGRAAPSAHCWQAIAVYALTPQGTYRYDANQHRLGLVSTEDLRAASGTQDFAGTAPLNLVYVADIDRMEQAHAEEHGILVGADAGRIVEEICLHGAACGLRALVRGLVDRRQLADALGLAPTQHIVLAQAVGYPADDVRSAPPPFDGIAGEAPDPKAAES